MIYTLSVNSFDKTFQVKNDGSQLTHYNGIRFKLFPFVTNNTSEPVQMLNSIIGRYLRQIERVVPERITPDSLTARLREKIDLDLGMDELFAQVVRNLFFDQVGTLRPINLKMLAQIPCEESSEQKLADYLVDVLGDEQVLKGHISNASKKLDAQSNALEVLAASVLSSRPSPRREKNRYQRITDVLHTRYEEDFAYILDARNRTRDYLIPLLEFYYFVYTAQTAMQLTRFLDGNRSECIPLYFCLDWEKTSQNRKCYTQGWNILQEAIKKIFAHAVVLEILNQTEGDCEPVDYILLNQLVNRAPGEDHRIAEEIKVLTNRYRNTFPNCSEMQELTRESNPSGETASEVRFLFESVKSLLETERSGPYTKYAKKFLAYCEKFLKNRGRSGKMLNLTEETLIFLTKICIKDQEKMRLNTVFAEFEARGVFLDSHSKAEVMNYYEKLNLIEKKSDSGDAQYVKRIL